MRLGCCTCCATMPAGVGGGGRGVALKAAAGGGGALPHGGRAAEKAGRALGRDMGFTRQQDYTTDCALQLLFSLLQQMQQSDMTRAESVLKLQRMQLK